MSAGLGGCPGPGSWGAMWAGWEGLSPPGSRLALVGADCVYTFPTRPAHARLLFSGSPTPGLCTVCMLAAPIAELPPSAENSSSGGCPGPRRPFLGPLSPVPAAGLKPVEGGGGGGVWTQCSQEAESVSLPFPW